MISIAVRGASQDPEFPFLHTYFGLNFLGGDFHWPNCVVQASVICYARFLLEVNSLCERATLSFLCYWGRLYTFRNTIETKLPSCRDNCQQCDKMM